jgi:large subunit ribosomal protein L23
MEFSRVILKPHNTEKSHALQNATVKKISFVVDPKATKNDISTVLSTIYGATPVKICTQLRKPTKTKRGTAHPGFTKLTKIAYVTFAKGTVFDSVEKNDIQKQNEGIETVDTTKQIDEAKMAKFAEVVKEMDKKEEEKKAVKNPT